MLITGVLIVLLTATAERRATFLHQGLEFLADFHDRHRTRYEPGQKRQYNQCSAKGESTVEHPHYRPQWALDIELWDRTWESARSSDGVAVEVSRISCLALLQLRPSHAD
jgi:hypothetical protein